MTATNMNVVNLTPHAINIKTYSGDVIEYKPSGVIARVDFLHYIRASKDVIDKFQFVPCDIVTRDRGQVINLPSPQENTIYIVSSMVLDAMLHTRYDVFAPDTGDTAIRNEKGLVIAVTRLVGK